MVQGLGPLQTLTSCHLNFTQGSLVQSLKVTGKEATQEQKAAQNRPGSADVPGAGGREDHAGLQL